jgi:L-threonylcarbamoyladenylate synthase
MRRWPLLQAARAVHAGGIIAYPTEGVFGLGCDPGNTAAIERLLRLKRRPPARGLILIAADLEQLLPYISEPTGAQLQRIGTSWPGPVTWLLPARPSTSPWLTGAHDTIAVRVTAHPLAAALCRTCDSALVSTSANRHGLKPAHTALQVRQQFPDSVDVIVHGPTAAQAGPTEIRDARTGAIIRTGATGTKRHNDEPA